MQQPSILITSSGRRVELVNIIREKAKKLLDNFQIITTDLNPEYAPTTYFSDKSFKICKSEDKDFVNQLLNISIKNNVKLIIPTIDNDLIPLSENKKLFESKNIQIPISDKSFIYKCIDKLETIEIFKKYKFPYPKTLNKENLTYPCFLKPRIGNSSKGIKIIKKSNEITTTEIKNKDNIIQQYVPKSWKEYSADMYFDKNSFLVSCVPRERIEIRGGEISKGKTNKNKIYDYLIQKFKFLKGAKGVITIQFFAIEKDEKFLGIEINPRFGGGYPMSDMAGADFSSLIIKEYLLNQKLNFQDNWINNKTFLRFDTTKGINI